MTNTLTWNIKPIAFPKVNTNLLSVVSLILLLTMAFLTFSVIADSDPCAIERRAVTDAENDVWIAGGYLLAAHVALAAAMIAQQWLIVAGLAAMKALAAAHAANQAEKLETARMALNRCIKNNKKPPTVNSGNCNSGGCA